METTLTKSQVIILSFLGVHPISDPDEGILSSNCNQKSNFTKKSLPLQSVAGEKNIFLVCFDEEHGVGDYVELLRAEGKQPCRNAPNYLLGLMALVPEDQMPIELHNKNIVAAEPGNPHASDFPNRYFTPSFLVAARFNGGRQLGLVDVSDARPDCRWAFLAEDLVD